MSAAGEEGSDSPLAQADRWHFSFAGLLLLLFGVFVILYASEKMKSKKQLDEISGLQIELRNEKARVKVAPAAQAGGTSAEDQESIRSNEVLQTVILKQVELLQQKLQQGKKENWVEAEARPDGGMLLRVVAPDLYRVGDPKVSERQRVLIEKLGEAIRDTGRRIRLEGHADYEDSELLQRKSDEGRLANNTWELSALRAAWVAQYWMRKFDFDPAKMEVVAYGRFKSSGTDPKSQLRRRLEVIIAKKGE